MSQRSNRPTVQGWPAIDAATCRPSGAQALSHQSALKLTGNSVHCVSSPRGGRRAIHWVSSGRVPAQMNHCPSGRRRRSHKCVAGNTAG